MLVSLRAAIAVALLAGFYVLAVGLIVGLVVVELLLLKGSLAVGFKMAFLIVPVVYALIRGLFAIASVEDDEDHGVEVTPKDQPKLWELVTKIAAQVGTRPPDEIWIVAEVNAAVSEDTKLLGLIVRRRRMYIGAPLLASFSEKQLSSVLAHELGHYSNRDTRMSGLVVTGRNALIRVINRLGDDDWFQRLITKVFVGYAKLYFRVSSAICRRQELAADVVSARIAGSSAAASALRELPGIAAVWGLFLNKHLPIAWRAGYLPTRLFDGFNSLRSAPELQEDLERLRNDPGDGDHGPYDSHPPTPDRIVAIEALNAEAAMGWGDRPASEVLVEPVQIMDAALLDAMAPEARKKKRVDWSEIGHLGARGAIANGTVWLLDKAATVTMQKPTLGAVLDALDAQRLVDLKPEDELPGDADAGPRVHREFARGFVEEDLAALVALARADAGRARWDIDPFGRARFIPVDEDADDLSAQLDAALGDRCDTSALRAALAAEGVQLDYHPVRRAS